MAPRLVIDPAAVRWSAAPSADRPLLIVLHGRGSNEADLFSLVPHLPSEPVVAALRAPLREGPGFAWYPLGTNPGAGALAADVDAAVEAVLAWLDSLGPLASIGLLGFSQGGAMALQLLRARPRAFSYAVQLAGFVVEGRHTGDDELAVVRPPVFWGRGSEDDVISADRIERTAAWLPEHATLETRVYPTGHSITDAELADVAAFIGAHLGLPS